MPIDQIDPTEALKGSILNSEIGRSIVRHCSVGASMETRGPGLATTFTAQCTPGQLSTVLDESMKIDPKGTTQVRNRMAEVGLDAGRCGISGELRIEGKDSNFKINANCPAPNGVK